MRFEPTKVALASIDPEDRTYRISDPDEVHIARLAASIRRLGLFNPVVLASMADNAYRLVSGFARLEACRSLGLESVEARIVSSDSPELACVLVAIADNSFQRRLNLIEEARAVDMLAQLADGDRHLERLAAQVGLPASARHLREKQRLCRMARPIQQAVSNQIIGFGMALTLAELPPPAGAALAELFEETRMSLSKQREVTTLVLEIAKLEGISALQVLRHDSILQLRLNREMDRNRKTNVLRDLLRRRRFPHISATQDHYNGLVKRMKLGERLRLIAPRDFEHTTYRFEVAFDNLTELTHGIHQLAKLTDHPALEEIIAREPPTAAD